MGLALGLGLALGDRMVYVMVEGGATLATRCPSQASRTWAGSMLMLTLALGSTSHKATRHPARPREPRPCQGRAILGSGLGEKFHNANDPWIRARVRVRVKS